MTTYNTGQGLINNSVNRLYVAQNGDILIATDGGLSRFNGTSFTNSLSGSNLRGVIEAQNGHLWATNFGAGVHHFNGTTWTTYSASHGIPHNYVHTVTEDLQGNIWVGTSEGVARFNGTTWTAFINLNGQNTDSDIVKSSMCDANGDVWFGSQNSFNLGGGVTRFDGTTWMHFNVSEGLAGRRVEDMTFDGKNNKWFASFNNGNSYFKDINYPSTYSFTTVNSSNGLIGNQVNGVTIDTLGRIWFATQNGVSRLTPIRLNPSTVIDAKCNTNFEGSITINAIGLNQLYYSSDGGNTFQTSPTFSGLFAGGHQFVVTDSLYSTTTSGDTINLIAPIQPGLPDSLQVCFGDSVLLQITNQGSNYSIQPFNFVHFETTHEPFVFPTSSTDFYLTMEDINGCIVEDSTHVTVLDLTPMQVDVSSTLITITGNFVSYKWYHYDQLLSGVFANIYAPIQPGIYYVYAKDGNGCTTSSGMIHFNNTSVDENLHDIDVNFSQYDDVISFELNGITLIPNNANASIYSVYGVKLFELPLMEKLSNSYLSTFNTANMPKGVYILHIDFLNYTRKFFSLLKK
jgi:streptogramin lyase